MSTTQWFRVASHTDKSFLPQRVGCPPGQPFSLLIHRLAASSVVYRHPARPLCRGLSGQTLRKGCASGRCLSAIRADRSASRLPLQFGLFGSFTLLREGETRLSLSGRLERISQPELDLWPRHCTCNNGRAQRVSCRPYPFPS